MPVTSTPQWNARHNGILGDASAMENANDLNQLLGTHVQGIVYQGSPILSPVGNSTNIPQFALNIDDIDQPFTMSGTVIGRVAIPLLATGNGTDVMVSLCSDNSGQPGTVITQTRIPASWITQLGASNGLDSAGALGIAANNVLRYSGWQTVPWSPPATTATGGLGTAQLAQSGNYFVFAGGVNATNGNSSNTVVVVSYAGGQAVSSTQAGPVLPQALLSGGFTVTSDSLVYVGGVNATSNGTVFAVQSTVYLASWDPGTGAIGTWSIQTALPTVLVNPGVASYAPTDTIYVVGGSTTYAPATAVVSTVRYANVSGGQITAWNTAAPLPVAVADPSVAVVGNYLIVAGGYFSSGLGNPNVYYAPINTTTGAPGQWLPGPAIPSGLYVEGTPAVTANAILWPQSVSLATSISVPDTLALTWDAHGPSTWIHQLPSLPINNADQVTAIVETSNGVYQIFNFQAGGAAFVSYTTTQVLTAPMVSVPISASGLTNGATYHLLIQQIGGDINNYMTTFLDFAVFSGSPTALISPRSTYNWVVVGAASTAVPLQIFNNSPSSYTVLPAHTWEDNGTRISTFVRNTTPDGALIGICEATSMTTAANANTGFETTLTPWTVTGGTMVQSSTQAFEGSFSCQVTPSGAATNVYITSELMPCLPGQSITAACQAWFTNSVTSNFSMSVNWYTSGRVLISTTAVLASASAATWTPFSNQLTAVSAPSMAYFYSLQPTLSGTPAAGQVFYLDNVIGYPTYVGQQLTGVAQVTYIGSQYPAINPLKATGISVLA